MFLTTHAMIGVALGQTQSTLIRGLLLSLASHYVLDVIPHSEHRPYDSVVQFIHEPRGNEARRILPLIILDGLLGLALPLILFSPGNFYEAFGILLLAGISMLPDALNGLHVYMPNRLTALHFRLHQFFHFLFLKRHWLQDHIVVGFFVQAVFVFVALYFFFL